MGRARTRWIWLGLGLLFAAAGCRQPDKSYVLLGFSGTADRPIHSIAVNLTLGWKTDSTSFEARAGGTIELPVEAALEIGSGEGDLAVLARALDNEGSVVAEGSGLGRVTAGQTSTVEVRLSAPIRDAGVDTLAAPDGPDDAEDGPSLAKDLPTPDPGASPDDAATAGGDATGTDDAGTEAAGIGGPGGGAGGTSDPGPTTGAGGTTVPETTVGTGGATTPPSTSGTGGTSVPQTTVGSGGAGGGSTSEPPPGCKLSVSPSPLDFGPVPVGTVSLPQPVIATNLGNGVCSKLAVYVSDGLHFPVAQTPCSGQTLGPNFSCKALFTFNPDAVGPFQTDASITPAEGPPVHFFLVGKGQDQAPQLMMNPTSVDFDIRDVASVSSMEFAVTSTGTSDPGALSVLLNGSPAFSVVSNQCSNVVLPKGGRCTFTLLFIPQSIGLAQVQIDAKPSVGTSVTSFAKGVGRDYVSLTVAFAGTGKGTVAGANLNCRSGSPCGVTFARTDLAKVPKVELSAQPDNSSIFVGWSGPCGGTGNCSFPMDGPKNVTAKFEAR